MDFNALDAKQLVILYALWKISAGRQKHISNRSILPVSRANITGTALRTLSVLKDPVGKVFEMRNRASASAACDSR